MKLTVCLLALISYIYFPVLITSVADDVVVRICKNDIKKMYSVFFSENLEHEVIIEIKEKGSRAILLSGMDL
ncbi:MAG: hypothetical protein ABJN36_15895 [Cyclobacteriaceae bacterium]